MTEKLEYCKACGLDFPPGSLSRRGLCADCAMDRILEARRQIAAKEGPIYERWKRNLVASMLYRKDRKRKEPNHDQQTNRTG